MLFGSSVHHLPVLSGEFKDLWLNELPSSRFLAPPWTRSLASGFLAGSAGPARVLKPPLWRVGWRRPRTASLCGQIMWFRGILNGVILFLPNSRQVWKLVGRITRLLASKTRAGLREARALNQARV